jgi:hypothetical protein
MNQDDLPEEEYNEDDEPQEFEGAYIVDDETADMLASAIGVLHMMSQVQLSEEARDNLIVIAEALRERFEIEGESMIVEEVTVSNPETGEDEILYRPPGGVFGDEPEEAEGPAPE